MWDFATRTVEPALRLGECGQILVQGFEVPLKTIVNCV